MTKDEKKQIEELSEFITRLDPFKKHLGTALHGYMNIRPEDTRKLLEAYHGPEWKTKVKPNVMTCGSCKLAAIKSIAIEYEGAKHTIEMIIEKDKKKKEGKSKDADVEHKA